MTKIFATAVAALLLATGAASALDTKICAVVSKTPDRFVAFREKPGTAGKMIAALREGYPLSIERSDQFLEEQEYLRYKNWTKWVRVRARLNDEAEPTLGWIYRRYITPVYPSDKGRLVLRLRCESCDYS
jgi:hypothetical protein